ncbi:MAG: hypothetical protein NZ927_02350 [Candidatus Calescibacterium sp.]|nr:hypothetical protein [Candidatus Calescibacterium sp.]MCX7733471.1 hypothetical protein [bacterium]MDW8087452.1 hypothetical protein [Candidatus Calescibacterium sp.]
MTVDVFRSKIYIIILVRDENERVVGVMPIKVVDFLKSKQKVSDQISDFFINLEVVPPVRIVFHRDDIKLANFISETFKEAERKIEQKIQKMREIVLKVKKTL